MNSYRELVVWQKSIKLVSNVYGILKSFPKDEMYCITSQIRRAAVSIPSNIAEGYGRYSTQDYIRFLQIARGSLYELQTQLEISRNQKYLMEKDYKDIYGNTIEIEKMLTSLIKKIS